MKKIKLFTISTIMTIAPVGIAISCSQGSEETTKKETKVVSNPVLDNEILNLTNNAFSYKSVDENLTMASEFVSNKSFPQIIKETISNNNYEISNNLKYTVVSDSIISNDDDGIVQFKLKVETNDNISKEVEIKISGFATSQKIEIDNLKKQAFQELNDAKHAIDNEIFQIDKKEYPNKLASNEIIFSNLNEINNILKSESRIVLNPNLTYQIVANSQKFDDTLGTITLQVEIKTKYDDSITSSLKIENYETKAKLNEKNSELQKQELQKLAVKELEDFKNHLERSTFWIDKEQYPNKLASNEIIFSNLSEINDILKNDSRIVLNPNLTYQIVTNSQKFDDALGTITLQVEIKTKYDDSITSSLSIGNYETNAKLNEKNNELQKQELHKLAAKELNDFKNNLERSKFGIDNEKYPNKLASSEIVFSNISEINNILKSDSRIILNPNLTYQIVANSQKFDDALGTITLQVKIKTKYDDSITSSLTINNYETEAELKERNQQIELDKHKKIAAQELANFKNSIKDKIFQIDKLRYPHKLASSETIFSNLDEVNQILKNDLQILINPKLIYQIVKNSQNSDDKVGTITLRVEVKTKYNDSTTINLLISNYETEEQFKERSKTLNTVKYLAIGDSISAGFNAEYNNDIAGEFKDNSVQGLSYPAFLASLIKSYDESKLNSFDNFGLSGSTIKDWLYLLQAKGHENSSDASKGLFKFVQNLNINDGPFGQRIEDQYGDFSPNNLIKINNKIKEANLLTISLGANDFIDILKSLIPLFLTGENLDIVSLYTTLTSSLELLRNNYKNLLKRIFEINSDIHIRLITYPMPLLRITKMVDQYFESQIPDFSNFVLEMLNSTIEDVGTSMGNEKLWTISVYDQQRWMQNAQKFAPSFFDIHPGSLGYQDMARTIFNNLFVTENNAKLSLYSNSNDLSFTDKQVKEFEKMEQQFVSFKNDNLDTLINSYISGNPEIIGYVFNSLESTINNPLLSEILQFLKTNNRLDKFIKGLVNSKIINQFVSYINNSVNTTDFDKDGNPGTNQISIENIKEALKTYLSDEKQLIGIIKNLIKTHFFENQDETQSFLNLILKAGLEFASGNETIITYINDFINSKFKMENVNFSAEIKQVMKLKSFSNLMNSFAQKLFTSPNILENANSFSDLFKSIITNEDIKEKLIEALPDVLNIVVENKQMKQFIFDTVKKQFNLLDFNENEKEEFVNSLVNAFKAISKSSLFSNVAKKLIDQFIANGSIDMSILSSMFSSFFGTEHLNELVTLIKTENTFSITDFANIINYVFEKSSTDGYIYNELKSPGTSGASNFDYNSLRESIITITGLLTSAFVKKDNVKPNDEKHMKAFYRLRTIIQIYSVHYIGATVAWYVAFAIIDGWFKNENLESQKNLYNQVIGNGYSKLWGTTSIAYAVYYFNDKSYAGYQKDVIDSLKNGKTVNGKYTKELSK
ncbi:lysophospholipase L1-like esterase [Mycoplasma testudineum]|uniref:Lysophospholipase L1-like esterase n=1 Tax=Mycoplasma testudineum TaxID=244584 RepID=A0A4R6IFR6_9MOLU|nr:SGNH/GDSL hydrolase family protein [Mycoplasma testudineum]OYD26938.1 hypothetical protein CG473_01195 [Mycoplasma testudineum]TDO20487.1 lysophospholipase L1-like esterase [Mycoplasma testudineum]